METTDPPPLASPCVSVCTVDKATRQCVGCLRTLQEIGAWRGMSEAEKRIVIAACAERELVQSRRDKNGRPLPHDFRRGVQP